MESLKLSNNFCKTSIYENVVVCEYVCPRQVHNLKHQVEKTKQLKFFDSEFHYMDNYTYQWSEPLNCFLSEWGSKHKWGRIYPKNNMSISICHRPTRHTLCDSVYVDFDIKNCNYQIILYLLKKFGFKYDAVETYCGDPQKHRNALMQELKISKDEAKQLFIMVSNGGQNDHPFLQKIIQEMLPLQQAINEQNTHMDIDFKKKNSLLAYFFQSIERFIQESCIEMICSTYGLHLRNIVPCQDGFMVLKTDYKSDMLESINQYVLHLGFPIEFIEKAFDEKYEIQPAAIPYMPFNLFKYGDAEFADLLKRNYNEIITTGKDKFLEAYSFNGIYWKHIPLHNAEFQQGCFTNLRDWLEHKLQLTYKAVTQHQVKTEEPDKEYMKRKKEHNKEQLRLEKEFKKEKSVYEKSQVTLKLPPFNKIFEPKRFEEPETKYALSNEHSTYIKSLHNVLSQKLVSLSMLKIRENIITMLLKSSYQSNIEWNKDSTLFAFENCIFDIGTKQKIKPHKDQFINVTCGYNYDNTYDKKRIDEVEKLLCSILPTESVRNYWKAKQSTMLTQDHPQHLFIQTGSGANGKSLVTDLTACMLGDYGYKLPSQFLQQPLKSGANPELANLRNKRGAWCSEPRTDMRLSSSVCKELTGDAKINGRGLYQSNCDIPLVCTFGGDLNGVPNFDVIDFAVCRRIKPIPFVTTAISQDDYDKAVDKTNLVVKNILYTRLDWQQNNKQALFHILMNAYNQEFDFDNLPTECNDKKLVFINASSDVYQFVCEIYDTCDSNEISTSTPIKLKEIYEQFKYSSVFKALKKTEQRELNYSNFIDKINKEPALSKFIKRRNERHNGTQLKADSLIGFKVIDENVVV